MCKNKTIQFLSGLLRGLDGQKISYKDKADYIVRKMEELELAVFNHPILDNPIKLKKSEYDQHVKTK